MLEACIRSVQNMFTEALSGLRDFKQLKVAGLVAGLETKMPLDHAAAIRGLAALQRVFPELKKLENTPKSKAGFILMNAEQDHAKQMMLLLDGYKGFTFAWGPAAQFGSATQIVKLFDTFQDEFGIPPVNIRLINVQARFFTDAAVNHYQAIWQAYFRNSPFYAAFKPEAVLDDDLELRFMLGKDRILAVELQSSITYEEILAQRFERNQLAVRLGIAETKAIDPDGKLSGSITPLVEALTEHLANSFLSSCLKPLDTELDALVAKGTTT